MLAISTNANQERVCVSVYKLQSEIPLYLMLGCVSTVTHIEKL